MVKSIGKNIFKIVTIMFLSFVIIMTICFIFYKPLHAVTPKIYGINKIGSSMYVDDISKSTNAILQYNDSIKELSSIGFKYQNYPKIIFCYNQKSYEQFGFKQSAARSIEGIAIVLSPRAITQNYFLKHELIHYWQEENLGLFYHWTYPQWVIEGMAYSISNDLRHPLEEPWESYRNEFETWYESIDKNNLKFELNAILHKKK